MATKGPALNKQTCTQLLENVLRQAQEGIKFTVKEGEAVVSQLKNCLAERLISQSQYDEAITAILIDDRRGSAGRGSE
jgi:hypothetical protein